MRFRPVLSAVLLAAYLPACTSFQSTSQPLAELTASPEGVDQVKVVTAGGARVDVWAPWVEADTLRGYHEKPSSGVASFAIPLSDIKAIEVRKTDVGPTVILVGVGALLIAGMISFASQPAISLEGLSLTE
jgi:hypothetical protein